MDPTKEQRFASDNLQKLIMSFPMQLTKREDSFASQIARAKSNSSSKLKSLYQFMDEVYQEVSRFTPCRKGCASCCHYSVSISLVEIEHIEGSTKHKRESTFRPNQNFHGEACPFLIEGKCSIYANRPFACRQHVTLTSNNTWCSPELANIHFFDMPGFSGINEAFAHILREAKADKMFDIRQVFTRKL